MRVVLVAVFLWLAAGLAPAAAQSDPAPPAPPATSSGLDAGPLRNLKFSGLIQVWYQAGDGEVLETFRLRRLRLYLSGDVTARARFLVMVDPSKVLAINQRSIAVEDGTVVETTVNQASRMLQDAYIALRAAPRLDIQVGQFKLPMNYEGSTPVQELPLVERSQMTTDRLRGGLMGDLRDIGVMARGRFDNGLEFRVGLFNGLGTSVNEVDKDAGKAVVGRLEYRTPLAGLFVGAFAAADPDTADDIQHRRAGVDVRYRRGAVQLLGEVAGGRDGGMRRRGYCATATWKFRPRLEAAARYDVWDPDTRTDTSRADGRERDYVGGINYYLSGNNLKWQAEYMRKTYIAGVAGAGHVFLANLQVAW
jgi:hypothetical protein